MTAPAEVPRGAGRVAARHVSTVQANAVRALLVATRREQTAEFAGHQATLAALTANSSADRTGLDRAMAALRMYDAREAIEEIEDALVRLDNSDHGSCGSCGRPIPFVHLDTIPQAGFCAACLTPMGYSADRLTAPLPSARPAWLPPQPLASSTSDDTVRQPPVRRNNAAAATTTSSSRPTVDGPPASRHRPSKTRPFARSSPHPLALAEESSPTPVVGPSRRGAA